MAYIKKEVIESTIINSGSDSQKEFGYPELEHGLHLQQNPKEFAELIFFLMTRVPPSELSLDIGIASGGTTKLLRDYYPCKKTIIVDHGQHHKFQHWQRIKQGIKTEIIMELIMSSHSNEVKRRLLDYKGQIDFAFIDGDHSYEGLRQDIELLKLIAKPGCVFVLHDTTHIPDCHKVLLELSNDPEVKLLKNIEIEMGISVWQIINRVV